jgi:hypothetical protein
MVPRGDTQRTVPVTARAGRGTSAPTPPSERAATPVAVVASRRRRVRSVLFLPVIIVFLPGCKATASAREAAVHASQLAHFFPMHKGT